MENLFSKSGSPRQSENYDLASLSVRPTSDDTMLQPTDVMAKTAKTA